LSHGIHPIYCEKFRFASFAFAGPAKKSRVIVTDQIHSFCAFSAMVCPKRKEMLKKSGWTILATCVLATLAPSAVRPSPSAHGGMEVFGEVHVTALASPSKQTRVFVDRTGRLTPEVRSVHAQGHQASVTG
jgi:hypothetical protein